MKRVVLFVGCALLVIGILVTGSVAYNKSSLVDPFLETESKVASNVWFPKVLAASYVDKKAPQINAKAAYFVDIDTGQVLYQKNPKQRLPIASLVKIMTSIVTMEHKGWYEDILVSEYAAAMEPQTMQIQPGEIFTVEELMYGLFLVSGNDVAEALAEGSVGDREKFIRLMNQKAELIGMKDTNFINPSGLPEGEVMEYSTAYDVALMSRFAIRNFPKLVDITKTEQIVIPTSKNHGFYELHSVISLLRTYPGVMGFKTGYTDDAGLTLVTFAKQGERYVLGVLLNSPSIRDESKILLDYSFSKLSDVD